MNSQWQFSKFGQVLIRQTNVYPLTKFEGKERLGINTEKVFEEKRKTYGNNNSNTEEE